MATGQADDPLDVGQTVEQLGDDRVELGVIDEGGGAGLPQDGAMTADRRPPTADRVGICTSTAPAFQIPCWVGMNSRMLGSSRPTRSPFSTPSTPSPFATRLAQLCICR